MNKKKLWLLAGVLALVLALVVVLIAIAHKEPGEVQEKNMPQIGLCLRRYEEDPEYGKLLENAFREAGFQVTVLDAKNDQNRQTKQVGQILNDGVALLVIEPVIADATEDTVTLLMEKNIPAVFIGNKPAALEKWNAISFVGDAEDQIGALQGNILLQSESRGDRNEDGQVACLVIAGPEEDSVAKNQADSCIQTLVTEGLTIELIHTSWGEWTEESGRIRCAKALSQYGKDVEVIICSNEALTLGALEAVKAGGWQVGRDYTLVGVGAEEKLQTKEITGTVISDLSKMTQQVLSAAQKLINGEAVKREYYVNPKTITAETSSE